ncbi:GNAT family N-acetyltransferase [Psychromonas sp. PT13]|uniref:GNAT family N-acetyltransferase n=1 Tax=Psychromonas sp. PT13 TaxID=3439547 RepID=UPI003EBB7939
MKLEIGDYYLRSLEVADCGQFYAWSCDREVTLYSLSSYAYPQSKSDIEKWLSDINSGSKSVSFGICSKQSDQLIGYAGISSISQLNRSGEFFILIGDKNSWGKGIGTLVTKVVTDYAIQTLGLHRVQLTASSLNLGAVKSYEKAGYQHEGIMRESGFRDGRFVDKILMSVIASEWQGI